MKKINIVQNWLKWRGNWSKMIFRLFIPPEKEKKLGGGGRKIVFVKNEKNQVIQDCLK